jgi:conjugative relaxase-like TrwC/TraI family protein
MFSLKHLSTGQYSAKDVVNYVENDKEKAADVSYYENNGKAPSQWLCQGAEMLGLSGTVKGGDLERLLEGKIGDQVLSVKGKERRMGTDMTFSAPKSVSYVGLGLGDDRVLTAHDIAVKAALAYIEAEVVKARYGKGGKEEKSTGNMITAAYRHEDARPDPVTGLVDMQLHTHCISINATHDGEAWRARTLDFGAGAVRMHTADAIYKTVLAQELQKVGYAIRQTSDGFEIDGITEAQIETQSTRRKAIDAELAKKGLSRKDSTGEQRTQANMATRSAKRKISKQELRMQWREDCRNMGIQQAGLEQIAQVRAKEEKITANQSIEHSLKTLSERDSVFSEEQAYLEALFDGIGHSNHIEIKEAMDCHSDIVRKQDGKITTKEALERDGWIAGYAVNGQDKMEAFINSPDSCSLEIERLEQSIRKQQRPDAQKFNYSQGQKDALMLALTSKDQITGIVGAAGAGKTTAMAGIVELATLQGYDVVGIAPSATAAKELEDAKASDTNTIATFILSEKESKNPRLVIVDEAGMVSSKDMMEILKKLNPEDKLLLVGDPRQLAAIEAGHPFYDLMQEGRIQFAEINEIQRQKDENLLAIAKDFADGRPADAVEKASSYMVEAKIEKTGIDKNGDPIATTEDRRKGIASDTANAFLKLSQEQRDTTLVLAGTNEVRAKINILIREGLKKEGQIEAEDKVIQLSQKTDMTGPQSKKAVNYKQGMLLRESGRSKNKQTGKMENMQKDWIVDSIDTTKNTLSLVSKDGETKTLNAYTIDSKHFRSYVVAEKPMAVNDKIVVLENDRSADISNGNLLTITKIEDNKIYALNKDGEEKILDASKPLSIDHGYALTIHKSQGQTVDFTIVAGEASRTATAEAAYVACSRERYGLVIITDNEKALMSRWANYAEREASHANKENAVDMEKLTKYMDIGMEAGKAYQAGDHEVEKLVVPRDKEAEQQAIQEEIAEARRAAEPQKIEKEIAD